MAEVVTRVAPSPTGSPHVGTLYIGLFNLAFARRHGGKFLLRIEDTDQTRSHPEYEREILEGLRWGGLEWDEGPDVGGPSGPYRQSERSAMYRQAADQLLEGGHAYRCFCTAEDLAEMRAAQAAAGGDTRYDGRCQRLPEDEVQRRVDAGEVHVVRLAVPSEGTLEVDDKLRDKPVPFDLSLVDHQVLLKSDGLPTYHLANVVDDHAMGVTHVIRGEDWLNSTPKHILLYRAFGWDEPEWYHMPLLRNADGSKLSKRKNPTSITYYRDAGYMPEALANFLCLMGYSRPDGEEKFDQAGFTSDLDLSRISLGGSVFDRQKLRALNGRYIREDLDPATLVERLLGWRLGADYLGKLVPLMHERLETMGDFLPKVWPLLAREVPLSEEVLVPKGRELADLPEVIQTLLWAMETQQPLDAAGARAAFEEAAGFWDWKLRDLTRIGFGALTGMKVAPPLFETIEVLGRDLVRDRFMAALEFAGGLSKKKAKKLDKRWQSRVAATPA